MKVVIAIDSMKGCLTSAQAGAAAAEGIHARWPEAEAVCLPVSDGGEGWLDAIAGGTREGHGEAYKTVVATVSDPLLRPVRARYLQKGEVAIIEVAEACGLSLLRPEERDPLRASSRGVGELVVDAMRRGCRRMIIGLGGSATSDAGRGMMEVVSRENCDAAHDLSITIATDVTNPLYGPNGAAAVFAPQKGATPAMVKELDERARTFAEDNARRMGFDRSREAGAGAAGGLGYAFMQFFGASQRSGAELLLELLGFDQLIRDADFIITGEGRADGQTLMGKLPGIILQHARSCHVPCHLIAGSIAEGDALLAAGFSSVRGINPPSLPLAEALQPEVARRNIATSAGMLSGVFYS